MSVTRIYTVIVLDDQSTSRTILARGMARFGPNVRVVPFDDASEAVDYARGRAIDLVLTDYRLQSCTGDELIACMRALQTCVTTKFIVVTASQSLCEWKRARDAGAVEVVSKPVGHGFYRRCMDYLRDA